MVNGSEICQRMIAKGAEKSGQRTAGSESTRRLFDSSRRVRLKGPSVLIAMMCLVCPCLARNHPPRFLIDGQTEIVVRLKEGPQTPVGK